MEPLGIVVDSLQNVYTISLSCADNSQIANTTNNTGAIISKISSTGLFTQTFTVSPSAINQFGPTNASNFSQLVIDSFDNLYYTGQLTTIGKVFTTTGEVVGYTILSAFAPLGQQFSTKTLTIDPYNNLYVGTSVSRNQAIAKISPQINSSTNRFGAATLLYATSGTQYPPSSGFGSSVSSMNNYMYFDSNTDFLYVQAQSGLNFVNGGTGFSGISGAVNYSTNWQDIIKLKVDNLPPLPSFSTTPSLTPTPSPTPTASLSAVSPSPSPTPTPSHS